MSTLEARVADAIHWVPLPFGGNDLLIHLDANAAHAVAKLLAPLLQEAQAEAWDEGSDSVAIEYNDFGGWMEYTDNPYRRSNDV